MKETRNPFRLRRAESIDTDAAFLTLFEPGVLEVLPGDSWAGGVHVFRSAPGGGKTSLLRLFTPSVLRTLDGRRKDENLRELVQRLTDLGAISSEGPQMLGVLLLCGPNYSMLQDLDLDQGRKDRLFFGLLSARIVLAALRSALVLRGLEFPRDLARVRVAAANELPTLPGLQLPCDGNILFQWAQQFEALVCKSLDSFGPLNTERLPGHDSLTGLSLIRPGSLWIDDRPIAGRVVLMMDDIHKLTPHQRDLLLRTVIESRSPVGVWIAERFDALNTAEILAGGAVEGRDVERPVVIESYWRQHQVRFEKHVLRVADRRVRVATEADLGGFRPTLDVSLDDETWTPVFTRVSAEVAARVRERAGDTARFQEWIAAREQAEGTPHERAIAWRVLLILIERDLRRPQRGLFDRDTPLDEDVLEDRDDNKVNQAAELFLAREYGIPYYFGPERIARLASLNILQFLGIAGNLFEEATGAVLLGRPSALAPARQHEIMKAAARSLWDEIPRRVPHGREVRHFLECVGRFSEWYTYRPTAPNDPGVGGTGIRMSERALLVDQDVMGSRPDQRRLAEVIASALAHNLLVADLDYRCKKEDWMVLNLNRLLCVHFDLPLGYGLYKERPLPVLCQWLDQTFVPPAQQETLL